MKNALACYILTKTTLLSLGDVPQPTPCYGAPTQINRRDSQEQIITQRMKQMTVYSNDGYCGPRSPYDHVPSHYVSSPGSDSRGYVQYYGPPAPPGNSYSNVVSRGKDVAVGKNTIF